MKTHLLTTAALLPFASLQAGETVTPVVPQEPATPVVYDSYSDLDWFFGGSAGFLMDAEEGFYSAHLGKEFYRSNNFTHSLYLEVGYSDLENDGNELDLEDAFNFDPGDSFTGDADIEATFIPITLNYKVDYMFNDRFSIFAGAGAGVALLDIDGDFNDSPSQINEDGNDSETSFYAQAFAGAEYRLSENFSLFGGARYMFIDDYEVTTDSGTTVDVDENDDVLVELGGRFRF
ncbi:outer membrane protein [Roseibacillus ishigakijimensis]|uniref:Porin family protein n=1 Tax=Roseibacillus ishigakijimensis TaxID=454146 RepID=A0A934VKS6_9BACT|nr:outer membrane beta-barrel protein [Roseibacillus ishigakijimensis]MBK1833959.1 porin family protein [Roseibacillus ishigakijimensis]